MFCLTLRGDVLEPRGCASSTLSGVNECPTHAMSISVDPLGEVWLDRRGQCALNLIIGTVIIPENWIPSRKRGICSCKGYSWIKICSAGMKVDITFEQKKQRVLLHSPAYGKLTLKLKSWRFLWNQTQVLMLRMVYSVYSHLVITSLYGRSHFIACIGVR